MSLSTRRRLALAAAFAAFPVAVAAQMPPNPPVDVALPLKSEVVDYDVYTGRFEAALEVELRARVSGYLDEKRFEDGSLVSENDVLFVIDQRPFENSVRRAEAALASAKAAAKLAEIELDRAMQLAERNFGTEQEVDRTQAATVQAEANVKVAEAELVQARLDLEYTEIRAPFDGRISKSEVDVGNLVVGGTSGTTMLAQVVSIAPIHFTFTASEADYLRYSRTLGEDRRPYRGNAMPAEIKLLDEEGYIHKAEIDFVENALNPNSGTIEVRATVENPDLILVPGVFGRIRVAGGGPFEALLIPDEAILSDQASKIVMTVDAENKVQPVTVTLGPLFKGLRAITDGLRPDARVIVSGLQRARPGAGVTPSEVTLELED